MTGKRFTYMEQFNGFCDVYDKGRILSCMRLEYVENTVNLLNELNDECEFLKIDNETLEDSATKYAELYHESLNENEQLKKEVSEQGTQIDFLKDENTHMRNVLNENKQLKQRNTNQYNQLKELWGIIEEENWEKLIAMKKQLKEDEERLQKEWGTYSD